MRRGFGEGVGSVGAGCSSCVVFSDGVPHLTAEQAGRLLYAGMLCGMRGRRWISWGWMLVLRRLFRWGAAPDG